MDFTRQRVCAWCGVACPVLFMIGFWMVAGFIPPPSPASSAHEIAEFYRSNADSIRIGMILSMIAAGLTGPFVAALTHQMRRIEGGFRVLTILQFIMGALLVLEFILFLMFWQVGAFRAERSDESIQLINDLGWIPFLGLTSTAVIQGFTLGAIILGDKRATPIIPRWAGYVNILVAMCTVPGSFNSLFKTGPLAWTGVLTFYIPMFVFMLYYAANTYVVLRAIRIEEREAGQAPPPEVEPDIRQLVARIAQLEQGQQSGRSSVSQTT
jgi:hypothetical protein